MKRIIKNILSIALSAALVGGLVGCTEQIKETSTTSSEESSTEPKELVLWYTNEKLSDYIEEVSQEYGAANNIVITPKLVSAIDYIENINQAVLLNEAAPDLFISENCDLEKLYLAGLTLENQDETYSEDNYYKTALNAFTYKDKLLAYPLYFESSYLLYNQEYVTTPPNTIDEILDFANEFDAPEGVENIFNWDVTDALSNYFFVGNYLNNDEIDNENYIVDKDKLIEALIYYQNLNQYFAIDADTVNYDTAFQNFTEGKSVFTIAKTDKLSEIELMEGDASEENQEGIQNGNNDGSNEPVSNSNEEAVEETNEAAASNEIQEKDASQDNEATSENNDENMESASAQSVSTQKLNSNTTLKYSAGIEKILNPYVSDDEASQKEELIRTDSAISNDAGTIIDKNSNFKIIPLPNLTSEIKGKGMAVSFGVFINGYTSKQEEANEFAKYLSYNKSAKLYKETGKLSSRKGIDYNNVNISNVLKEYDEDVASPKLMENGDFGLQLEILFSNIWKGADVTQTIDEMSK
ncbi:MAG: extracellular solute-binding protein [Lachnotalea sp.]